jgi:hypothetical protein
MKSKSSPKGGKRGCLCKDNTYSSKCCTGELYAQGIGALQGGREVNKQQDNTVTHIIRIHE